MAKEPIALEAGHSLSAFRQPLSRDVPVTYAFHIVKMTHSAAQTLVGMGVGLEPFGLTANNVAGTAVVCPSRQSKAQRLKLR